MAKRAYNVFALKHGKLLCPRCKADITWGCPGEVGERGSAKCANSVYNFRVLSARDMDFQVMCGWRGYTIRLQDGDVAIFW